MAFQDPVVGGTISNAKPFQLVDNLDLACATPVWILSCSRWDGFSQSLRFDDYSEKHLIWGPWVNTIRQAQTWMANVRIRTCEGDPWVGHVNAFQ